MKAAIDRWIDGWNPYDPKRLPQKDKLVPVAVEDSQVRSKFSRYFLLAFFFFMVWALWAPIDDGVPVTGVVTVEGNRKSVQHPSGGVITAILVREGDPVKEGDTLIRINPLGAETSQTGADLDYINLLANEARLNAERRAQAQIQWPAFLAQRNKEPRVLEAMTLQQGIFQARRAEYGAQLNSLQTQVRTLREEYQNTLALAEKGFVPKNEVNAGLRSITSAETALANHRTAYTRDVESQLAEIQRRREALEKQLKVASVETERTLIKAPVSGVVVGMKVNTIGGVIGGGAVLMEIVPQSSSLILEVKVPPTAIDKVFVGLQADIRFTAFSSATTPVVEGKVLTVGADRIPLPNAMPGETNSEYFLAIVRPTPEGLAKLGALEIQPGMPADVIIKTGERSFMSYFAKPLTDRLAKAFKDS
jgi:protease secretion system membrane fusion protein